MSDASSNLIGFLKKKSLFATSPDKNKRQRQSSRDSKNKIEIQKSQKLISHNPEIKKEPVQVKNNKMMQKHNSVQQFASADFDSASQMSYNYNTPNGYENSSPQQKGRTGKREFNFEQSKQPRVEKEVQNIKNTWAGMITKAITFQSARIESAQCLDNLLRKIKTQISSIDYKIDSFRSKMYQILNEEFANLRQKITEMVGVILKQSQKNINFYIKQQQKSLAADLVMMRSSLAKEHQKIEVMKDEIEKPNWRKVAGELLSSELEQKIDDLLLKSEALSVKHWEVKDLGITKLPTLERQLKNIVKIDFT